MHLLTIFAILFLSICSHALLANPGDNIRMYGTWLGAPNVTIYRFQSTLIIPAGGDSNSDGNMQAFWPGMEPYYKPGVFQNVVWNGNPGEWLLVPYYCCDPVAALTPQMRVYPGDTLTNTFSHNKFTMQWHNSWIVIPGPNGQAAGTKPFSGDLLFNPEDYNEYNLTRTPYTWALFSLELHRAAMWDFGEISWRDILLEINTLETSWCTNGPWQEDHSLNYTYSTPVASTVDNVVRCYIAEMNFMGLN